MSELRKPKRGISTKRGDHLVQNGGRSCAGQNPFDEGEEQQRYWPSPRAPPVSPSESPRTPGGSQKKAVLGKVKSKAKKWMHLLHNKKKPAHEELMWTPRSGPGAEDIKGREQLLDAYFGTPSKAKHPTSSSYFERTPEVFMDATPRQNSPAPSPTAHKGTTILQEQELGNEKNGRNNRELSEAANQVFRNAYETLYQAALKMISKIQEILVAYNIDRRHMLEKVISVNRYLLLKLEPGQDDRVLSEVVTEAVLDLYDTWIENVERPLVQRAKEISSWFLKEGREVTPAVPLSSHPCVFEDAEEFYSLEN
ncbi:hypothetical protein PR202_ga23497 [Eleusine coracana subsp. coracana]|uniref:LTI65/LTI78 PGEED repeat domain-containing protein n=1 Tax=Eleusine coracana subsp. coracana TaxID=191504 RepID=A0AAV5D5B9_ELECO|nr:hypothetical protein PR202_ga23497 [Eleusine coracana subsp. coracana]